MSTSLPFRNSAFTKYMMPATRIHSGELFVSVRHVFWSETPRHTASVPSDPWLTSLHLSGVKTTLSCSTLSISVGRFAHTQLLTGKSCQFLTLYAFSIHCLILQNIKMKISITTLTFAVWLLLLFSHDEIACLFDVCRDALLASLLDGVRASGNRDVHVKMVPTPRGKRIGPLNVPVEEEVEMPRTAHITHYLLPLY